MHGVDVDASGVVVELVPVAEVASHALSVRRRKPPWYSYEAVTARRASQLERSLRPAPAASASGVASSVSIAWIPAVLSASASVCAAHAPQTAPPARGE